MKFFILASLILLGLIIYRSSRRLRRERNNIEKDFWAREDSANNVRRKSLDSLNYIQIPLEQLPLGVCTEDDTIAECVQSIEELQAVPIVNLTGYTNTDLKLTYGTANITVLSEYDQNYTTLACTLQKWAGVLYEKEYVAEARTILEFAVSTGTDVSQSYYLLARIYAANMDFKKIEELLPLVEQLRSSNKASISRTLQETYL